MAEFKQFFNSLARWRVRMAIPAALLVLIFAQPTKLSLIIGFFLCFLGLLLRSWASGHLNKNACLATSGPYRFSRNPLYFANLVLGLGLVAAANSLICWLLFLSYFLAFYPATILKEQHKMAELFPQEYGEYERKVPLFFPRLRTSFPPKARKFSSALYLKNKEYKATLAILGFWLLLFLKRFLGLKP